LVAAVVAERLEVAAPGVGAGDGGAGGDADLGGAVVGAVACERDQRVASFDARLWERIRLILLYLALSVGYYSPWNHMTYSSFFSL